ncbi:uncharacterized protein CIMG_07362 [Coccidioides immitis RS]|uniref:Rhodopsin domain-containing protein n=1 Tax=Coccidioides immitis (strain RS) TaxID=246410 RepID=J3KA66_COCIM|nr:uncharacterized protein CIMG_07362 [Coccidioides immitis RS]EAS31883.3 hypothetical protein CIMG_07362 [Coccidioides immitis RS]
MTINYGQGTPSAPSRGYQLYITALVMVLVAALFVFARIFSRIATKRVGLDDYLVIAALVSSVFLTASINLGRFSIAQSTVSLDLTSADKKLALKWFFIAQPLYKLVLGFTKAAIVCLYIRIFVSKLFQRVCRGVLLAVTIWAVAALLATIFQCLPIEASWDKSIAHKCINKNAFWYGFAVTNTSLDFILLLLPIQPVLKLHLHWKEKVGLLGVFALGTFVCITSIIRTTAVAQTTTGPKKDITWDFIPRSVWTLVEANTGIICACLPILKGPLGRLFPRLFHLSTGKGTNNRYGSGRVNSYVLQHRAGHEVSGNQVTNISTGAGRKGAESGDPYSRRSSEEYIIDSKDNHSRDGMEPGIMMKREIDVSYETEAESSRSLKQTDERL